MCIYYFCVTTLRWSLKNVTKSVEVERFAKGLKKQYWLYIWDSYFVFTVYRLNHSSQMTIIFFLKTINQDRKSVGGNPEACTWKIHWTEEIDLWLQICSRPFSALHLTMPNGSYEGVHHVAFSLLGKVLLFHQGTKG